MTDLTRKAMATLPFPETDIEKLYLMASRVAMIDSEAVRNLCASHERLRRELGGAEMVLASRTDELEQSADKLSGLWIHLDAYARGETFTAEMAKSILRHQQAPGWKK